MHASTITLPFLEERGRISTHLEILRKKVRNIILCGILWNYELKNWVFERTHIFQPRSNGYTRTFIPRSVVICSIVRLMLIMQEPAKMKMRVHILRNTACKYKQWVKNFKMQKWTKKLPSKVSWYLELECRDVFHRI